MTFPPTNSAADKAEGDAIFDSIELSAIPVASPAPGASPTAACQTPNTLCLGVLAAGTHSSEAFEPRGSAADARTFHPGAVTYAVPEGWANASDSAARYTLVPQAGYPVANPPKGSTLDQINVLARPAATVLADACDFSEQPGVGHSVAALVDWMTKHPGIVTSAPQSITIDGHTGTMLDAHVDPAWTGRCDFYDWGPLPIIGSFTERDFGTPRLGMGRGWRHTALHLPGPGQR